MAGYPLMKPKMPSDLILLTKPHVTYGEEIRGYMEYHSWSRYLRFAH